MLVIAPLPWMPTLCCNICMALLASFPFHFSWGFGKPGGSSNTILTDQFHFAVAVLQLQLAKSLVRFFFFPIFSLCRCGLLSSCGVSARNGNISAAADGTHTIQFIEWDPATPELINLNGWVSVWANPDLLLLLVPEQGLYFSYLLLEVIV